MLFPAFGLSCVRCRFRTNFPHQDFAHRWTRSLFFRFVQVCLFVTLAGGNVLAEKSSAAAGQLLHLPMHFEANEGQAAQSVEFLSRGPGYTLFLTQGKAVLSLRAKQPGRHTESTPNSREGE